MTLGCVHILCPLGRMESPRIIKGKTRISLHLQAPQPHEGPPHCPIMLLNSLRLSADLSPPDKQLQTRGPMAPRPLGPKATRPGRKRPKPPGPREGRPEASELKTPCTKGGFKSLIVPYTPTQRALRRATRTAHLPDPIRRPSRGPPRPLHKNPSVHPASPQPSEATPKTKSTKPKDNSQTKPKDKDLVLTRSILVYIDDLL